MPYALRGNCVIKKDTGETVKCHDSHEKALKHLAALEINVHHKMVMTKESGVLRWTAVASGSYGPDRDRQWMTEKALKTWADNFVPKDGKAIPLRDNGEPVVARYWHVGLPDPVADTKGPGLDLGVCDLAVYHSKSLIMSGTFYDQEIGEKFAQSDEVEGLSIGYFHPITEPINGAYHTIDVFEVSFLPVERAAYPFTGLSVMKGS